MTPREPVVSDAAESRDLRITPLTVVADQAGSCGIRPWMAGTSCGVATIIWPRSWRAASLTASGPTCPAAQRILAGSLAGLPYSTSCACRCRIITGPAGDS